MISLTRTPNMLSLQKPSSDDGGDYKCIVKNEHGQLQAKLNLNIEAEPPPDDEEEEGGILMRHLHWEKITIFC